MRSCDVISLVHVRRGCAMNELTMMNGFICYVFFNYANNVCFYQILSNAIFLLKETYKNAWCFWEAGADE